MEQVTEAKEAKPNGAVGAALAQSAPAAIQQREYRPAPLVPTNLDEAWRMAKALAGSGLLPDAYKGNPENVLAAFFMATDLGISVMQAMREIYIVHGSPGTSSLLKVALVKQSPECVSWKLVESTDTRATFETQRRGEGVTRHTYTLEDAKTAQLYPGARDSNWAKRPKLMLRRRCASELADEVYPDVVKGLRTEDEAHEIEVQGQRMQVFAPPEPEQAAPSKQSPVKRAPEVEDIPAEPEKTTPAPMSQTAPAKAEEPDIVMVLLELLVTAKTPADVDGVATRARASVPKDHPRRQELGEAINLARKRVQ